MVSTGAAGLRERVALERWLDGLGRELDGGE